MRNCLNLRGLPDRLIMFQATLGVDEVGGEDGVDESALAQTGLANNDDIELKSALEKFVLNLAGDGVKSDVRRGAYFFSWGGHSSGSERNGR